MDAYLKLSFKLELKEGFVNENEQYKSVKAIVPKQWWQSFFRRYPMLTFHIISVPVLPQESVPQITIIMTDSHFDNL